MNGGDFAGLSYGDSFQQHHSQQHRIRSMSWCDGSEITTTTNLIGEMPPIHLAQEEVTLSPDPNFGRNEIELPSCSTEVINLKKPSARKNAWGCLSYADLIAKAIESSPNQRLTLNQIYSWMVENVPYFRAKGHTNSSAGWKNSIRHNLSLHGRFVRVQNEGAGKSSWWMVNNNNRLQKTPRRRSSTLDSKALEKKRKISHHSPHHSPNLPTDPLNQCNLPTFYKSACHLQQQQMPYNFQYPAQQQQRLQKLDSFETAFRSLDRGTFNNNNNNNNINNKYNLHNSINKNKNLSGLSNFNQYNSNSMYHTSNSCFSEGIQQQQQQNLQQQQLIFDDPLHSIASSTPDSMSQEISNNNNDLSYNNTTSFHDNSTNKPTLHFGNHHNNTQQNSMVHIYPPHHTASKASSNGMASDIFCMPEEAWRNYLPPSPDQLTETVISSESLTAFLESGAESEMVDLVPPLIISTHSNTHLNNVANENSRDNTKVTNNIGLTIINANNNRITSISNTTSVMGNNKSGNDDGGNDSDVCNNHNSACSIYNNTASNEDYNNVGVGSAEVVCTSTTSSSAPYKSNIFCNDTSNLDCLSSSNTHINNNSILNHPYHQQNDNKDNFNEHSKYEIVTTCGDVDNATSALPAGEINRSLPRNGTSKILDIKVVSSKQSLPDNSSAFASEAVLMNKQGQFYSIGENASSKKKELMLNGLEKVSGKDAIMNDTDNCHKPLLYNILQNNTLSSTATTFNNKNTFNNFNNNIDNNVNSSQTRDDFYPKIVELLSSGSDHNTFEMDTKTKSTNNTNECLTTTTTTPLSDTSSHGSADAGKDQNAFVFHETDNASVSSSQSAATAATAVKYATKCISGSNDRNAICTRGSSKQHTSNSSQSVHKTDVSIKDNNKSNNSFACSDSNNNTSSNNNNKATKRANKNSTRKEISTEARFG